MSGFSCRLCGVQVVVEDAGAAWSRHYMREHADRDELAIPTAPVVLLEPGPAPAHPSSRRRTGPNDAYREARELYPAFRGTPTDDAPGQGG